MGLAPCSGQCMHIKASQRQLQINNGRYNAGQVRCTGCEIYLTYQEQWGRICPCCHGSLRFRPKNSEYAKRGRIYI